MRFAALIVMMSLWVSAAAETKVPPRSGPYLGIQPGVRDVAPNTDSHASPEQTNALTWVGFDMSAPGGRVFLQTSSTASYEVLPTPENEVLVRIKGCKLNWKNDGHHLDTAYFPSVVKHVQAKVSGDAVEVHIKLKKNGNYDLRQEGSYIFLEFVTNG